MVFFQRRCVAITSFVLLTALVSFSSRSSQAALVINPAQPIVATITVQPIIVSNDGGSETATYFGTPAQQSIIETAIDSIWAQAGIDVTFLSPDTWNDTFAYDGGPTDYTGIARPTFHLSTIVADAATDGKLHADPNVINMFFVDIVPGFSFTSENTANGLAFVGANGVTQFVGDDLLTFGFGQEVVASVVAHEIGHNLGLPHIVEGQNLMQEGGSPDFGQRLNSGQIATALGSNFSVLNAVPEPSAFLFFTLVSVYSVGLKRWA